MTESWSLYHPEIPEFLRRLADTPPMARLRQVGMNCGCEYTAFPRFAGWAPYSRFDHSLGVGLIVWHFTGDLRQSAAGLLHDVATPVFAHTVDFLNGDHLRQEATEALTAEFIARSPELQALLREYGLTTADVADYHRYPIADNDSPQLSADRLEYTLGDLRCYGFADAETVMAFYTDLTVEKNEPVFRSCPSARRRPPAHLRRRRCPSPASMWRMRTALQWRPWPGCCAPLLTGAS